VVRSQEDVSVTADVVRCEFPNDNITDGRVPIQSVGEITLKSAPAGRSYKEGEILQYKFVLGGEEHRIYPKILQVKQANVYTIERID